MERGSQNAGNAPVLPPPLAATASLGRVLRPALPFVGAIALLSVFINLLRLTIPLYMIQVIDRVLSSESTETLVFISIIAAAALVTSALLSSTSNVVQGRIGAWLDERLFPRLASASFLLPRHARKQGGMAGVRELGRLRQFFASPTLSTLLEVPWTGVFIAILYYLHPWMGTFALVAALALLALALLDQGLVQSGKRAAQQDKGRASAALESAVQGADALRAMGMEDRVAARLARLNLAASARLDAATQRGNVLQSLMRFLRMGAQIGVLGVGAFLALNGEITTGTMIAGSILLGLALSPVDKAVGAISSVRGFFQGAGVVNAHLSRAPERADRAAPDMGADLSLSLRQAMFMPQGLRRPVLRPVSLDLAAGEMLGVIGPVAAGKTTLTRMIVGVLPPSSGSVLINSLDAHRAAGPALGARVGYAPQEGAVLAGTIAENISRFDDGDPHAVSQAVAEAATLLGVHEAILALPDRYDTPLESEGSALLSRGQLQQILLARAFYGRPRLLVLDEPASYLDKAGEAALVAAVRALHAEGATVVAVTQRQGLLNACDKLLYLRDGNVVDYGEPSRVRARLAGGDGPAGPRQIPGGLRRSGAE